MFTCIKKWRAKLSHYTWDLAYGDYSPNIIFNGFDWKRLHILKNPYKTKWFADPFILETNEKYISFLVEEFDSSLNRGRIARVVANKNTDKIEECHILLDLPSHLSFPAIYRVGTEIYVHPENSASGRSAIYRYDRLADKLVEPIILIERPLVDAIIRKKEDKNLMFATEPPDAGGCQLNVYESSHFLGNYNKVETITFKRREARMAGAMLESQLGTIRPAQDCNNDYGEAVIFYCGENRIAKFAPKSYRYEGLHTFNTKDSLFVIDLKKYDYPLIHRFLKCVKRLIIR